MNDEGVEALVNYSNFPNLLQLYLQGNHIASCSAATKSAEKPWTELQTLDLSSNRQLSSESVINLVSSISKWGNLQNLMLSDVGMPSTKISRSIAKCLIEISRIIISELPDGIYLTDVKKEEIKVVSDACDFIDSVFEGEQIVLRRLHFFSNATLVPYASPL